MLNKNLSIIFVQLTLLFWISKGSPIHGQSVKIVEDDEFKRDFAFMGSLGDISRLGVHKKLKNHFCGCVLISKRHVLTAAHCLDGKSIHSTLVTFGSTDLNHGQSYEIATWKTFKAWAMDCGQHYSKETYYDDIAVITLSSVIRSTKPAVISKLHDHEVFGKKVIAIGWGLTEVKATKPTSKLRKGYLNVLNNEDCKLKLSVLFGPWNILDPNEYCTHAIPPVILGCGDSGGPILLNGTKEIVGINTSVCTSQELHEDELAISMHMKVRAYRKFIKDILKNEQKCNFL